MHLLQIKLLGDFSLVYDKQALTGVNTARLQSLLCYLMLHCNAPQSRQHLAFLLWPDSLEGQARTNLRQLLHYLRRSLPLADQFLDITGHSLQWRLDSNFQLDVAEFDCLANDLDCVNPATSPSLVLSKLERAVALYRGELLPSCYDEWILPERDRLHGLFLKMLERLVEQLEEQRQYQNAILYAERLLQHDPTCESATLQLMRLNALNGERTKALRVYNRCVTVLKRELDISPGLAVREAYGRLLSMETSATEVKKTPVGLVDAFPLVGRAKEWKKLQSIWQTCVQGAPQFVSITGEAGIGKSRLAQELLAWARRQGITRAWTRSYHAEGKLAYAPAAEWLRSHALKPTLNKLDSVWLTEVARLLPEILSEHPELPRPAPLTEDSQRQRLFEALSRAFLITKQPLILMIDDLQWCDRETQEWLHYLLRFDQHAPILIVATIRTGESQVEASLSRLLFALRNSGQLSEMDLGPLDKAETLSLAKHLEKQNLDPTLSKHLYQETEGNPLFVVEYMRAGLSTQVSEQVSGHLDGQNAEQEAGASAVDLRRLPPKVQTVIQARLEQLTPNARDLICVASVIGRAFSMEVLSEASKYEEGALVAALDELWQRRMIRELHAEVYDFSHDKIREVAYLDISPMLRRFLHFKVAQALETLHANNLDLVSAALAAHYEQADCPEQAIVYYQWAAGVTQRIYANEETIRLCKRALSLLETLPENREHAEKELALQTSLGIPLVAIKGYGASDVMTALNRTQKLCKQLGKPPSPPILRALAIAYLVQGQLQESCGLGDQLLHLAEASQNDLLHVEAHYVLGVSFFWLGKFTSARKQLERAIVFYRRDKHHSHVALYSQDAGVICLIRLSYLLGYLGQPEAAATKCKEALDLAEQLAHPFSLAYALNFATWLHHDCHDWQGARALNKKAAALSREQRLGFLKPMGEIFQGVYLSQDGELETGITLIRGALDEYEATGQNLYRPYALSLLAQVYEKAGEYKQALTALDEALSLAKRSGLHFWDSALYRLKGEFLLQQGEQDSAESEVLFEKALKVSRKQGAISLELPAAIRLSRLCLSLKGSKKKAQAAAERLKKIIGFFNEGCETRDLKEAKTLLNQLSKN